jgi:hypothetical protein
MDDPRAGVKTTLALDRAPRSFRFNSGAPFVFEQPWHLFECRWFPPGLRWRPILSAVFGSRNRSVYNANNRNAGLRQYVRDLRFAQARSIVFKGKLFLLLVHTKAPQAVGICKFAEPFELLEAERRLQFKCDLDEGHAEEYSRQPKQ